MSPSALIRASGLATIVGGTLFALFPLLHPGHDAAGYTSAMWVPAHMLPNVAAILVLFGLVGLLARQLDRAGLFGVIAFVVAFIGTASFVMGAMIEAFIIPFMGLQTPEMMDGPPPPGVGEAFMVITSLFGVGHVVLGLATYRARVLPRNVGGLLVVGALANLVLPKLGAFAPSLDALWVVGFVLFGAAIAWLGYSLWSGTPDRDAVPGPSDARPQPNWPPSFADVGHSIFYSVAGRKIGQHRHVVGGNNRHHRRSGCPAFGEWGAESCNDGQDQPECRTSRLAGDCTPSVDSYERRLPWHLSLRLIRRAGWLGSRLWSAGRYGPHTNRNDSCVRA